MKSTEISSASLPNTLTKPPELGEMLAPDLLRSAMDIAAGEWRTDFRLSGALIPGLGA